jgi:hypothetical protein
VTPRFVFRPAAVAELREARDGYDAQREELGSELGVIVDETLQRMPRTLKHFRKSWWASVAR